MALFHFHISMAFFIHIEKEMKTIIVAFKRGIKELLQREDQ